MAVTWIAAKIEEQTHIVQLNDVALVFDVLQQRENGKEEIDVTDPKSEKFKELRAEIATKYEMGVFHALGFICHVDHPHKLTANLPGLIFYDSLRRTAHIPDGLLQVLPLNVAVLPTPCSPLFELHLCSSALQEAWGLANDSLKTTLCVRFRSLTIACACIFLAARRLGIAMPEDPPWWEFADTSFGDMATVCAEIVSLHGLPTPVYISVNKGETAASVDAKLAASKFEVIKTDEAMATGCSLSPRTQSPTVKSTHSSGQAAAHPSDARARAAVASSPSGSVQGGSHDEFINAAPLQGHRCDFSRADSAADRHDRDEASDRRDREFASDRRDREDGYRHRHGRTGHRDTPKSSRASRRKRHHDGPDNARDKRDGPRDRSDSSRGAERMTKDRHIESFSSRQGDDPNRTHTDSRGRSRSGQRGRRREADHRSSPLHRRSPVPGTNSQSVASARIQSNATGSSRPSAADGAASKPDDSLPGPPSKPARTLLNWEEMTANRRLDSFKALKRRADSDNLSAQADKVHCPGQRRLNADRREDTQ